MLFFKLKTIKNLLLITTTIFCFNVTGGEVFIKTFSVASPAGEKYRAFGSCSSIFTGYKHGDNKVWEMQFLTEGKKNASVIAGKFLTDLKQSTGIIQQKILLNKTTVPVFITSGKQAFAIALNGAETTIFGASSLNSLKAFLTTQDNIAKTCVANADSPGYLSRWGWGFYGLGPFSNYHGWMNKFGAKGQKDPMKDMEFIQKYGFHFEPWLNYAQYDNSDSIMKNNGQKWMIKEAEKRNIPFSFRVYVDEGAGDWTARRFPEHMEQPASFLQSGWLRPKQYWKARPHLSWYSEDIQNYLAVKTKKMMDKFKHTKTNGWMHPHGELTHDPWFDMHSDFSQKAQKHWRNYLQKQGITLKQISRMYGQSKTPLSNWDQVAIPEFATFSGLPGKIKSLSGQWYYKIENTGLKKVNAEWWEKTEAERYQGLKEKWYSQKLNLKNWTSIEMPGSDNIFTVFKNHKNHKRTTWFRRSFDFNNKIEAGKQIYLYFYPISNMGIHSGEKKRYHKFFLNGKFAGKIGRWGAIDVTKQLKSGLNELAFQFHGSIWNGRIFLSTSAPKVFPYLGKEQNRLWLLWDNWRLDAKYVAWRNILDIMRQSDPNRPIKFMAPISFTGPRWRKLALNYGGWPHFTGEGIWFFPWYKRYGALYGIPASSELAGPCKNLQDQFNGYRRVFLAGLDGHEPVFLAQTYTRNPKLRKWWIDHNTIIKRMGKYNIYGPQVLLYRSTRNTVSNNIMPYPALGKASRQIQSPWNWDLGRGTMQTLGYSYLYLDDDGIEDGKMYGHKVIIDSGNETISKKSIAKLKDWVEAGGIYVALPFSGRNSLLFPDSWPIMQLTGCQVGKERKLGKGTVTVAQKQDVLKTLAGKTFPDDGKSMDYIGNNLNNLSFELVPGKDCQVLARYENGVAALVKRKLGQGYVITMGSAFWRNAQDKMGIWWPEKSETKFIADLLKGLKFDQPLCVTDDRLVWAQPYRSNNGLESVSTLVSWHEDKDVNVNIKMRLPKKPVKIISYGVDGVKTLAFKWNNGIAELKINMPAKEVKVICAEAFDAASAIQHWWNRQRQIWRQLVPSTLDLSKYQKGKWLDPTMDLSNDAKFTNAKPRGRWTNINFNDSSWKATPVDILNFWGAKDNTKAWLRKSFKVPEEWLKQGGEIKLISGEWTRFPSYQTPTRMFVNGKMLHDFSKKHYNEFDITKLLNKGENILAFEIQAGEKYIGFSGDTYLYYKESSEKTISLNGDWHGTSLNRKAINVNLPGTVKVKHPSRKIFIPAEWKGKYKVRLYMTGSADSILGGWVNQRLVRRFHHHFGNVCDIDITESLKFGEDNIITLAKSHEYNGKDIDDKKVPLWNIKEIKLELYPVNN